MELYIHIPFCRRKCAYCDFLSFPSDEATIQRYVRALQGELRMHRADVAGRSVKSVFIGGGTPSIVDPWLISDIMDVVRHDYPVSDDAEITIEMNPGTVTADALKLYRRSGINRLSIGLQSADNRLLEHLGRIHTFERFLKTYDLCRRTGFDNINIDLMSGLPGQSIADWQDTLMKVTSLRPNHISAYSLIVEEGTPFYEKYGAEDETRRCGGETALLPSEEEVRAMDILAREILESRGYHQYEFSNYAKKGFECYHNIGYWTGRDYLGFGLGASSLFNHERRTVCSDIYDYMEAIEAGDEAPCDVTELTRKDEMEEFMFLGLRMTQGISRDDFEERFDASLSGVYGDVLNKYSAAGLLAMSEGRVMLTPEGVEVSNIVLADFLL